MRIEMLSEAVEVAELGLNVARSRLIWLCGENVSYGLEALLRFLFSEIA